MPNPLTPSRVKAAIPSNTGSLCERLSKLFQFVSLFHEDVAYKVTEAGTITEAYKADLCALGCTGGGTGTPNPNMPAPTGINATDGSYSDKIRVSWNAVTPPAGIDPVTEYKVYRSLATNTDPTQAELVGTVTAPTVLLDDPVDSDLVVGTTYNYWVKATNGSDESAFSGYDVGSADAPTGDIDPVADLRSIPGHGESRNILVWTPPTGASKYDIYRGTTNVFADATLIFSDVVPKSTQSISASNPECWDNVGEIVFYDDTAEAGTNQFYYWVVAKKNSPPAESTESNEVFTWCGDAAPAIWNGAFQELDFSTPSFVVPAGITKLLAIVTGGGGGGAGGGATYGGGGGGGGGTVYEEFTVTPGDTVGLVFTPNLADTGNAAAITDGADGCEVKLQVNAVDKIVCNPGLKGVYSASGGGTGGAGGSGTGTTSPTVFDGKPGRDGSGSSGGQCGYFFGGRRLPSNLAPNYYGEGGFRGRPGSGGSAYPLNPALSIGGKGGAGWAKIYTGT